MKKLGIAKESIKKHNKHPPCMSGITYELSLCKVNNDNQKYNICDILSHQQQDKVS